MRLYNSEEVLKIFVVCKGPLFFFFDSTNLILLVLITVGLPPVYPHSMYSRCHILLHWDSISEHPYNLVQPYPRILSLYSLPVASAVWENHSLKIKTIQGLPVSVQVMDNRSQSLSVSFKFYFIYFIWTPCSWISSIWTRLFLVTQCTTTTSTRKCMIWTFEIGLILSCQASSYANGNWLDDLNKPDVVIDSAKLRVLSMPENIKQSKNWSYYPWIK